MRYYDRTNLVEYNWFYQDCCLWILHNFQDKYTLEHYWTLFVEVNVEVLQIWRWLSNNECHYSLNVCAFTTFLFLRRCLMSSITLLGFSSGYLLIMRYITSVTVSHHIASNYLNLAASNISYLDPLVARLSIEKLPVPDFFLPPKLLPTVLVEYPKRSCNFIETTLRHGCSPVNLLHILRTPFPKKPLEGCSCVIMAFFMASLYGKLLW